MAGSQELANTAYTVGTIVSTAIVATFSTLYGVQKYGWGRQITHSNGSAGTKSVDFWTNEIRRAVADELSPIVAILERQTEILNELRLAITELTTIARERRGR